MSGPWRRCWPLPPVISWEETVFHGAMGPSSLSTSHWEVFRALQSTGRSRHQAPPADLPKLQPPTSVVRETGRLHLNLAARNMVGRPPSPLCLVLALPAETRDCNLCFWSKRWIPVFSIWRLTGRSVADDTGPPTATPPPPTRHHPACLCLFSGPRAAVPPWFSGGTRGPPNPAGPHGPSPVTPPIVTAASRCGTRRMRGQPAHPLAEALRGGGRLGCGAAHRGRVSGVPGGGGGGRDGGTARPRAVVGGDDPRRAARPNRWPAAGTVLERDTRRGGGATGRCNRAPARTFSLRRGEALAVTSRPLPRHAAEPPRR